MKKQCIYLAALLLLAGCAADNLPEDTPGDGLVPIRLSSGLEVQARAHTGMDAQISAGRSVAFWVDNATSSTPLYDNNVLTANGSDGFTGGTAMYYPGSSDNVDVYALHTNATLAGSFPTVATHTVAADQTAAVDYYNSDLLYAASKDVAKTPNAVPVTFYHMLSKVRIAIKPGTVDTDLAGATVRILGTKMAADFAPDKTADMTSQAARAAMVAASGRVAAITVSNEASEDFTTANVKYNDAVVVPQTVASGVAFISITLWDGTELEWSPAGGQTFESGKRYTYHVTVTHTGLKVTSSVVGWEDDPYTMPESNCYMVEPDGWPILIPAVSRANRAAILPWNLGADATGLGGVSVDNYTVELVWGDTPVGENGVIKEMRPDVDGYIYVKPGVAGNAVICIKVGGVIKWSWHIWVTEQVGRGYDPETWLTWMDRNLGAGGKSFQPDGKNGLFYQWGRKDAFPASDGTVYDVARQYYNIQQYYTEAGGDTPTNANPTGVCSEMYQMVQNPLNFAIGVVDGVDVFLGSLNERGAQNNSWGGTSGGKTIYDPCPPGWKMPPISVGNTNSWAGDGAGGWENFADNWRVFNGVNGTAMLGQFYPVAGRRVESGTPAYVGRAGYYWSSTPLDWNSYALYFSDDYTPYTKRSFRRNFGHAVRCVSE